MLLRPWLNPGDRGIYDLLSGRSMGRRHEANPREQGGILTFWKFEEIPKAWFPSLRSEAIATQSLPTMATTDPPLYSIID